MSYNLPVDELSDAFAVYKTPAFTASAGTVIELFTNNFNRGRFYPDQAYVYFNSVPTGPVSFTLNVGFTPTGGSAPYDGYNDWVYLMTVGSVGSASTYKQDYVFIPNMVGDTAMTVPNRRKSLAPMSTCYVKIPTGPSSPVVITVAIEGYHMGIYNPVSGSRFIETINVGSPPVYRNVYDDKPDDIIQGRLIK